MVTEEVRGDAGCDGQESGVVTHSKLHYKMDKTPFHYFLVRGSTDEKRTLFQQYVAPPLH